MFLSWLMFYESTVNVTNYQKMRWKLIKAWVKCRNFHFTGYFFYAKICYSSFFGTVFVTSLISWFIITRSPIILPKCLPFSQVHVLGFQI